MNSIKPAEASFLPIVDMTTQLMSEAGLKPKEQAIMLSKLREDLNAFGQECLEIGLKHKELSGSKVLCGQST